MPTDFAVARSAVTLPSRLPQVEPIALTARSDPFDDPLWVFEPKYDGLRALVYSSARDCEIRTLCDRRPPRLGDLRNRLAEVLQGREAILDGEIVSLDRRGKPILEDLLRGEGYLAFASFDLLWLDGVDLRGEALRDRKQRLASLLPEDTGPLYKVLTIEEHGRALFGAIRKMDLEGVVAKCKADPYTPSTLWYKISNKEHSGIGRAEVGRQRARRLPASAANTADH